MNALLRWIMKRRAIYRDNTAYHAGHSETYWHLLHGVITPAQVLDDLSERYHGASYARWSVYDQGRYDAVQFHMRKGHAK